MYTYSNGQRKRSRSRLRKHIWRDVIAVVALSLAMGGIALLIALPITAHSSSSINIGAEETPLVAYSAPEDIEVPDIVPHDAVMTRLSFTTANPVLNDITDAGEIDLPKEDVNTEDTIVYIATRLGVEVKEFDSTIDYSAVISNLYNSIELDDPMLEHILALCEVYECQRNLKIEYTGADESLKTYTFIDSNSIEDIEAIMNPHVPYMEYTETDVEELAALIYAEAGSDYMTDYHKQCVGSVVLCRLADPDTWGDYTIHDVIWHPGQYPETRAKTYYDERCYNIAKDLLENGPVVYAIWQANFPQGENVEYFDYGDLCRPTWIDK